MDSAGKIGHFSAHLRAGTRRAPQRKLLALLILLAFPASQPVLAEAPKGNLPDLAQPAPPQTSVRPSGSGLALDRNDANSRFTATTETSQLTGISVGVRGALALADTAALGGGAQMGGNLNELYLNLGLRLNDAQRLMFTGGQLRQKLEFNFPSGSTRAEMIQNSGGVSWRLHLGSGLFDHAEANAYAARTASRALGDVTYVVDTAALYELWSDPRRIAGGRITGLQGRLGLKPWNSGHLNLGFGQERLQYDLQNGNESHNRATGSINLEQGIGSQTRLKIGADAAAAQNRYNIGIDYRTGAFGTLGLGYVNIQGRDNAPDDNRVQLSWTLPLGKGAGGSSPVAGRIEGARAAAMRPANLDSSRPSPDSSRPSQGNAALLDQVAKRPEWMPAQVIAKLDTTATPTRLIAVDKTALPSGATLDPVTGNVNAALPRPAAGIAGVTRNGAVFANAGQFALVSGSLVVNPKLIEQPPVGVKDTYVVTLDNSGGGTTLVTVVISHGSVKIDSISVADGDVTPPVISGLAVGGIAALTASLTATLNEAGSGYYVILPATAATPSASQIKNGQDAAGAAASKGSAVMTANTPATFALAGLTAGSAYKLCFAAGDSANNLQPAVSTTSFTTAAAKNTPDAFDIADMIGQPVATAVTTNTLTISGINIPVSATTSVGTLVKNGVNTNAATVSVVSGDTLAVRLTTAATITSPAVSGTLTIGTLADGFSISTAVPDTLPDAFSFAAQGGVAMNSKVEANAITVSGINTASPVSVSGGEYQVNGGAWTSAAGTVSNGNTVKVRHTSAAGYSGATQTTLTIGGVAGVFASTTLAAPPPPPPPPSDTTPDAFAFVDQTNIALSTLTASAAITVAGIDAAAAISVVGGEYQINGGAWTAAAGSVTNGQTVKVRHTSSGSNATAVNTTLTIGGVSDIFTTTTLAALPAGYVSQGGLTWTPDTIGSATFGGDFNGWGIPGGYTNWTNANTYCTTTTINGQNGWHLPTTAELSALYVSGAMNGQGWALSNAWSSTPHGAGGHEVVALGGGAVDWFGDAGNFFVSCVR